MGLMGLMGNLGEFKKKKRFGDILIFSKDDNKKLKGYIYARISRSYEYICKNRGIRRVFLRFVFEKIGAFRNGYRHGAGRLRRFGRKTNCSPTTGGLLFYLYTNCCLYPLRLLSDNAPTAVRRRFYCLLNIRNQEPVGFGTDFQAWNLRVLPSTYSAFRCLSIQ